jgi:hypothetical protein
MKTPFIYVLAFAFLVVSCSHASRESNSTAASSPASAHTREASSTFTSTYAPKSTSTPSSTDAPDPTTTDVIPSKVTDEDLDAFLRTSLSLSYDSYFSFVRGVFAASQGAELIVFYVFSPYAMPQRGIIRNADGTLSLEVYEDDPCNCTEMDSISLERLVPSHSPFLVVEYSPITGTCVGVYVLEILTIEEGHYFEQALKTYTYLAYGTPSKKGSGLTAIISDIEYADINGDGIVEIIQNARVINCGDDCFCFEGPVEEEFLSIFMWDGSTQTFVEQVAD